MLLNFDLNRAVFFINWDESMAGTSTNIFKWFACPATLYDGQQPVEVWQAQKEKLSQLLCFTFYIYCVILLFACPILFVSGIFTS